LRTRNDPARIAGTPNRPASGILDQDTELLVLVTKLRVLKLTRFPDLTDMHGWQKSDRYLVPHDARRIQPLGYRHVWIVPGMRVFERGKSHLSPQVRPQKP
jgi:hypothetical protein